MRHADYSDYISKPVQSPLSSSGIRSRPKAVVTSGYRRPTAHPVRVIEARRADCLPRLQPRRADPPAPHVRRRRALPGPAGRSSRRLWLRALWVGAQGDGAARLCDRLRLAAPGARDPSAHCADRDRSTKSRCDRVGRLSPSHRAGRDRRSTASTAARLGARSANLGQTAHYSQAIAHFVDRRSRTDRVGPVGWPNPLTPRPKPLVWTPSSGPAASSSSATG